MHQGHRRRRVSDGKIDVLLATGRVTVEHDNEFRSFRHHTTLLTTLLEATGRFRVRVLEEFRGVGDELLDRFDVVLVMYEGRDDYVSVADGFGDTEVPFYDLVTLGGSLFLFRLGEDEASGAPPAAPMAPIAPAWISRRLANSNCLYWSKSFVFTLHFCPCSSGSSSECLPNPDRLVQIGDSEHHASLLPTFRHCRTA